MEKSFKKHMEPIQTKCSFNKGLLMLLVFSAGIFGCASFQEKDKPTLLLEEIQKEQAGSPVTGEPIDEALWESAQIEKRWIPAQFRANRYIPGHHEYVVVTPGRWKSK